MLSISQGRLKVQVHSTGTCDVHVLLERTELSTKMKKTTELVNNAVNGNVFRIVTPLRNKSKPSKIGGLK